MREKSEKFQSRKRIWLTVWEIGKWVLVLWLLWPMHTALRTSVDFTRIVIGIALFVIFIGKLLYDTVIYKFVRQRERSGKQDLLSMLGVVLIIAFVVGLTIAFIGWTIVQYLSSATSEIPQ